MRNTRKGFTLVELLIVITIMASLSAMMAITSGGATSRAKASSIVANVEACKTAAAVFYNDHWQDAKVMVGATETNMADTTAEAFLGNTAAGYEYVPNFSDFSTDNIVFTVDTTGTNSGKGRDNWAIKVTFKDEAEADNISMALAKAKGYSGMYKAATAGDSTATPPVAATPADYKHTFIVNLTTGVITPTDD